MHPGPIIHSFLCMCVVYMFLCLLKCTCVYLEVCYKYWVFLNHSWPGSLGLTFEREGTSISGPASQLALGILSVCLSSFRITVAYHTHSAFTRRPSRIWSNHSVYWAIFPALLISNCNFLAMPFEILKYLWQLAFKKNYRMLSGGQKFLLDTGRLKCWELWVKRRRN